jgi:hypothetical protein
MYAFLYPMSATCPHSYIKVTITGKEKEKRTLNHDKQKIASNVHYL